MIMKHALTLDDLKPYQKSDLKLFFGKKHPDYFMIIKYCNDCKLNWREIFRIFKVDYGDIISQF